MPLLSFAFTTRINAKFILRNHLTRLFNTKTKFVDRAVLDVCGGKGGNGCVSFNRLSPSKKRPTGGSGGKGGNVIIVADKNVENLNFETFQFKGGDGRHGGSDGLTGRNGNDSIVRVPLGTIVTEKLMAAPDEGDPGGWGKLFESDMDDDDDEDEWEAAEDEEDDDGDILSATLDDDNSSSNGDSNTIKTTATNAIPQKTEADEVIDKLGLEHIFFKPPKSYKTTPRHIEQQEKKQQEEAEDNLIQVDLDVHNSYVVVAYGGRAGVGNGNVKRGVGNNKNSKKSTPATAMPGQTGEKRSIELELKIIADVGLVGMPNAGKSTLLSTLTNATPKIASYAFTTLHPNIGVIQYSDFVSCTVADIPGLIEGASEDRGLGHEFLRHIERTKILIYVLDGSQGINPMSYSSFAARNKNNNSSNISSNSSSTDTEEESDGDNDGGLEGTTASSSSSSSSSSSITRSKGRRHPSNKNNNTTSASNSISNNTKPTTGCPLAADLSALYHELEMYNPALVEKPALLFINKTDIIHNNVYNNMIQQNNSNNGNNSNTSSHMTSPPIVVSKELLRLANKLKLKIFYGSALKEDGIGSLAHSLRRAVESYSSSTAVVETVAERITTGAAKRR